MNKQQKPTIEEPQYCGICKEMIIGDEACVYSSHEQMICGCVFCEECIVPYLKSRCAPECPTCGCSSITKVFAGFKTIVIEDEDFDPLDDQSFEVDYISE